MLIADYRSLLYSSFPLNNLIRSHGLNCKKAKKERKDNQQKLFE